MTLLPKKIENWDPEDDTVWNDRGGKRIAWRNLCISIFTLFLAFAVWILWSVVAVYLPVVGFELSDSQLFLLVALPSLTGAVGRILYSFMIPVFGGRRFNAFATALLLIPTLGLGFVVQYPEIPFWVLAVLAATAGFGGANFSSSMDHIAPFFPERKEGTALGLNGGIGNFGVSVAQFLVPLVIGVSILGLFGPGVENPASGELVWIQNAGFIWVPFLIVGAVASYFGLNDIAGTEANVKEQLIILRRKHTWIMCWLYIGTSGSFLGYAAAFPLLTGLEFPDRNVAAVAFWGPLIGALIRPLGGWLADKLGGALVTLWVFVGQAVGILLAIIFLNQGEFWGFFGAFLFLFLFSGLGNGSTFKMIPVLFRQWHLTAVPELTPNTRKKAISQAETESGSVLAFSGGIGAFGGFFIPLAFSRSVEMTGATVSALAAFFGFYCICIGLTWYYYLREEAEAPC